MPSIPPLRFPCKGPWLERATGLAENKAFFVRPWPTHQPPSPHEATQELPALRMGKSLAQRGRSTGYRRTVSQAALQGGAGICVSSPHRVP